MMKNIVKDLKKIGNKKKAKLLQRFFKTKKGEYGEGDIFLGVTVPESRKIAKKYRDISFTEISKTLKSKYHEVRLVAILILIERYKKDEKRVFDFYLKNIKYINNWDLVDLSAYKIVGNYLLNKDKKILEKLAKSDDLWQRRIAIVSTFAFINNGSDKWTQKIAKILINDPHDLIHKANGWMLREAGKKVSETNLYLFLNKYGLHMPRTMLRYTIERLPEKKRLYYLKK
ncbi:MAG: DNA alkylation repair protein [Patescibacteria group bacterium]|nr:DNA alkylation repair protein [Patescibacteria group bacterium]